jgi:hypothetical protein
VCSQQLLLLLEENKHVFVHPALLSFPSTSTAGQKNKRNGCTADRQKCELSAEGSLRGNILAYNGASTLFAPIVIFVTGEKRALSRICMQKPGHFAPIGISCNEFGDALAPTLQYRRRLLRKLHEPAQPRPPACALSSVLFDWLAAWFLAEFIRNTPRSER